MLNLVLVIIKSNLVYCKFFCLWHINFVIVSTQTSLGGPSTINGGKLTSSQGMNNLILDSILL